MVGIRKIETTTYLPAVMAGAVSAVAVSWSNLELEMEHAIRVLGKMPHRGARILVTGMNARTRMGCIEGLYQLRRSAKPGMADEIRKIKAEIENRVEGDRNKIVHAVWHRTKKDEYFIVRTSGTW